ncbi:MAG TPA: ATP-dependent DNA helicase RecG, partial [Chryseobacterium sp.]|nr:ATP-dependent DNA helicase RecG [Chryseobacterium sp.]
MTLDSSIEFLKGIGPERAKFIRNVLGISTVEDLLTFYPLRYIDKSKIHKIGALQEEPDAEIQLKGKITDIQEIGYGKGQKRMTAKLRDETGTLELVWFRYSKWMKEQIPLNREIFIFGKVNLFNGNFSMPHPEIEMDEKKALSGTLLPIYPGSEKLAKRGINNKFFQNTLSEIVRNLPSLIEENLPDSLMKNLKLIGRIPAFYNIHFPKDLNHFEHANRRIKFEEAFFFKLGYGLKKQHQKTSVVGNPFPKVGA